ncbi:snoal-like polyketide cyclase family [Fusarium mexicanum]|uniref:Snoal-like polyketide cyclase family n=1 Tax=Fusarium mexicanum TaxID=751941 RepID=A0A8H5JFV7_9HYPO|nr:snoal-like polyketide cyclase family [Fusarium mexicanum]
MILTNILKIVAFAIPFVAATPHGPASQKASYCGDGKIPISDAKRLALFQEYSEQLHFKKDITGAFAKYVSPDLTEHTQSAGTYDENVAFLKATLPLVNITIISDLVSCGRSIASQPICILHYKIVPNSPNAGITNTSVLTDVYRYEDSCIVEHWDSLLVGSSATTNPNWPG